MKIWWCIHLSVKLSLFLSTLTKCKHTERQKRLFWISLCTLEEYTQASGITQLLVISLFYLVESLMLLHPSVVSVCYVHLIKCPTVPTVHSKPTFQQTNTQSTFSMLLLRVVTLWYLKQIQLYISILKIDSACSVESWTLWVKLEAMNVETASTVRISHRAQRV